MLSPNIDEQRFIFFPSSIYCFSLKLEKYMFSVNNIKFIIFPCLSCIHITNSNNMGVKVFVKFKAKQNNVC